MEERLRNRNSVICPNHIISKANSLIDQTPGDQNRMFHLVTASKEMRNVGLREKGRRVAAGD